MNDSSPCFDSGCTNSQDNNQTSIAASRKTTNVNDMTTKLAGIGSAKGTGPVALNQWSMLEIQMYFTLVFIL